MDISDDLIKEVKDIHQKLDYLGFENGYGYMTFVLCTIFRFHYPFQIRYLWDPKKYIGSSDQALNPITVRRLMEDIPQFIMAHPEIHPRCYHCGNEIEDKSVQRGSGLSFFLCDSCDGKHVTMDTDTAMRIHEFIQREKGEM